MAHKLLICIVAFVFLEQIDSRKSPVRHDTSQQVTVRTPPVKPLAMSRPFSKNQEDRRRGQDYIEQYQEMMKASQESFESFDDRDDKRLRRLIGDDDLELMAEAGGLGRRRRERSGSRLMEESSPAWRRRARSQVIRRNKLHVQSVSSHKRHSKPNFKYGNN